MVYLIALALGTMATLTFFQLIPEAIDIYHSHKVVIPCSHASDYQLLEGQPYSLIVSRAGGGPSVPGDGSISHKNDSYYEGDLCYLKFAGPKMYIWEMLTVFCMVILFYNIQVRSGPDQGSWDGDSRPGTEADAGRRRNGGFSLDTSFDHGGLMNESIVGTRQRNKIVMLLKILYPSYDMVDIIWPYYMTRIMWLI